MCRALKAFVIGPTIMGLFLLARKGWVMVVEFDPRIESYGNFINNEETNQLRKKAKATKIHDAVERLLSGWEALSSIRALPSILNNTSAKMHHASADHYLANNEAEAKDIVRLAVKRMNKENKAPLDKVQVKNLNACIKNIVGEQRVTNSLEQSQAELWKALIGVDAVQNLLFVSQRVVIANLYSQYEVFAQDIVRMNPQNNVNNLTSMARMRLAQKDLGLTDDKIDEFYSDDVRIVKDLRDAILHSGCLKRESFKGEIKSGLMKLHKHDGTVFVTPHLVDVYFQRLWKGANFIIDTAIALPKYQNQP